MGRKEQRKNRLRGEEREVGEGKEAEFPPAGAGRDCRAAQNTWQGQHPNLPVSEADPRGCTPDGCSVRGRRAPDMQLRGGPAQF